MSETIDQYLQEKSTTFGVYSLGEKSVTVTFKLYYNGFEITTENDFAILDALECTEDFDSLRGGKILQHAQFDYNLYEKMDEEGFIFYEVEKRR